MTRLIVPLFAALAFGCAQPQPAPVDPVAMAAEIARAVVAHPGTADAQLARHDLTQEEFDALMYEIAEDPAKTAAFEAARARPSSSR